MIIVSSFTHRIYPRALPLCNSLKNNINGVKAVVYYEDVKGDSFSGDIFKKFGWINWVSLNRTDRRGLRIVDSFDQFKKSQKAKVEHTRYMNYHAQFWFRKIVAIRACSCNYPNEKLILWADADCEVYRPLLDGCTKTSIHGDIGYLKRTDKPTDTGLILFNTGNPVVKEFIEEWYQLYISGKIFKTIPYWADHYAFDYVMTMPKFSSLKYYDLQLYRDFCCIIGHARHGHLIMAKLRHRPKEVWFTFIH